MKVKYIGSELISIEKNKIYDVISIEKGWYRIMTELDETYLFPPELFEVIDSEKAVMSVSSKEKFETTHGIIFVLENLTEKLYLEQKILIDEELYIIKGFIHPSGFPDLTKTSVLVEKCL